MMLCRRLPAVLLLLVFTAQSLLAVGAPCLMPAQHGGEMAAAMAAMDHQGHAMPQAEHGDSSCCDGGYCSMSDCQSVVAMPDGCLHARLSYAPAYGDSGSPAVPETGFEFLYRPPIFR